MEFEGNLNRDLTFSGFPLTYARENKINKKSHAQYVTVTNNMHKILVLFILR